MPEPLALRSISSWTPSGTVHNARAAAVHCLVCHGAHVNQQPELIASVELFQIHVLSFIFSSHKEGVSLFPMSLSLSSLISNITC